VVKDRKEIEASSSPPLNKSNEILLQVALHPACGVMLVFLALVVALEVTMHSLTGGFAIWISSTFIAPGRAGAPGNPGTAGYRGLPGDSVGVVI
jgi:hypothetical protein